MPIADGPCEPAKEGCGIDLKRWGTKKWQRRRELRIRHNGEQYLLRLTRLGKLILIKSRNFFASQSAGVGIDTHHEPADVMTVKPVD